MNLPGVEHSPIRPQKEKAEVESQTNLGCSVSQGCRSFVWTRVLFSAPRKRFKASLRAKKRKLMAPEAVSQKSLTRVCPDLNELSHWRDQQLHVSDGHIGLPNGWPVSELQLLPP